LHDQKHQLGNANVLRANEWLRREMIGGSVWQIDAEIEPPKAGAQFTFQLLRGPNQVTILGGDTRRRVLWLDRTQSGRTDFHSAFPAIYEAPLNPGNIQLRIFIDTSSIEVFANEGETVLTSLLFPATSDQVMKLATSNDALKIKDLAIWKLSPVVPIPTLSVSASPRKPAPDLLGPQPKELRK